MPDQVPVLIGVAGLIDGEVFTLPADGTEVVVGRSRSCTISLRKAAAYLRTPRQDRDQDHDFNTVSRRHLRLTVSGTLATVEDISSNGTLLDGQPLSAPRQIDLAASPCLLRLGTREQVELRLLELDDPRLGAVPASLPS